MIPGDIYLQLILEIVLHERSQFMSINLLIIYTFQFRTEPWQIYSQTWSLVTLP